MKDLINASSIIAILFAFFVLLILVATDANAVELYSTENAEDKLARELGENAELTEFCIIVRTPVLYAAGTTKSAVCFYPQSEVSLFACENKLDGEGGITRRCTSEVKVESIDIDTF